jgi:hypothetical protein
VKDLNFPYLLAFKYILKYIHKAMIRINHLVVKLVFLLLKALLASFMSLFLRDREKLLLPDEDDTVLFFIS